jgi:hypothetical protein
MSRHPDLNDDYKLNEKGFRNPVEVIGDRATKIKFEVELTLSEPLNSIEIDKVVEHIADVLDSGKSDIYSLSDKIEHHFVKLQEEKGI